MRSSIYVLILVSIFNSKYKINAENFKDSTKTLNITISNINIFFIQIAFVLSLLFCHVTSTVYYVIPTIGNQSCPTDQVCHTLSYYISNITLPSNVTLLFINGEHLLLTNEVLHIKGINNVTLLGQGQWVQGFHQSVMQSSVIIKCTYNTSIAINVYATTVIYINNLTITHCSRGIVIDSVLDAQLNSLSAQNSSEFGLWINNTATVTIDSCSFSHNGANTFLNLVKTVSISYSNFTFGHAQHVLSIQNNTSSNITIVIIGCIVHSNNGIGAYVNSSNSGNHTVIIQNTVFSNNIGGVGGLFMSISAIHSKIVICGVSFLHNTGTWYQSGSGGAFIFVEFQFNNTVIIQNTTFVGNNNGGLYLDLSGNSVLMTLIKNTTFLFNVGPNGQVGGALIHMYSYCFTDDISLYMHNLIFDGNTEVALHIYGNTKVEIKDVDIVNTLYNNGSHPSQYAGSLQLICSDERQTMQLSNVYVTNNTMTGVFLKACLVVFYNNSSIISNNKSPGNGGGMYVDDTLLWSTVPVHLNNNTAIQYGGAIYFTANLVLTSVNPNIRYCSFFNFNGNFLGNHANIAGIDVYGGYYYNFSFSFAYITHFGDVIDCKSHSFQNLNCLPNTSVSSISSAPLGACICINNSYIDCTQRVLYKEVYHAQTIALSLVTVGMCGGISPGPIITKGVGFNVTLNEPEQITDTHCKSFTYQIKSNTTSTRGKITIKTGGSLQLNGSVLTINITLLPCPLGLVLDKLLGICVCDDIININAIRPQCSVTWMPYPIKRSGNNWLSYNEEHNCIIAHTNCPNDYCNSSLISFNLNNSDLQCMYNRSGFLCGQCQSGLSLMLGSNKCGVCTNSYIALIAAFVFGGLCLCVLLLTLNLTVSVGSINGLLFYANIIKLNKSVLFSNKQIPVLNQFIAWLNLDLGIETCFFNGLDGYWKTWLQLAFSLSLITGLIICCRYSGKLSRLCGNNVVPVLSTLILMAHSKLLITIKNALMLIRVQCEHTVFNVWSVDGNIKYLHDKHIPLFVVSVIFFFIGFIYTVVIFLGQWLQHYTGKYCRSSIDPFIVFKPFIDVYYGPYKDKYQFWTGYLLIIRLFVTGLFAVTTGTIPQVNNYVITIIVLLSIPIVSRGIYKMKINTALEMIYLFNLGIVSLLNTVSNYNMFIYYVDIISVSLSLLVFVVIVLAHIYMYIKQKCGKKLYSFYQRNQTQVDEEEPLLQERLPDKSKDQAELYSPAHTVRRRESLIFDFHLTGHLT